ncbi:transposase [Rhodococcus percolatus]|nr:transposase [Rhodococcus opacus]MBP2208902.1 transposase [Rhodococcus opacus]
MIVIGIDPHKSSHTATAVDPATNTDLGSIRIDATLTGYRTLIAWAKSWPTRQWAVENAEGLGHHLAQWLLGPGETVLDIPTTATARIRELSRGGRRKNDRIDAAAAACVAALQGDARPVDPEGPTDILALLDERRTNMSHSRTRLVNQLHALLRQLFAGGAPTSLTAASATTLLRGFRARSEVDRTRVGLCRDLIADIRRLDDQLAANEKQMAHTLDEHGTRLREVDGIGAVTAARLIGRTGRASRFPTAAAYANYNGSAPVQIATASPATATDNSTARSTPSRWSRSGCPPAPAERTTTRKSMKANRPQRRGAPSNGTYPITSGASCSPTRNVAAD